jgi:(heptosyl)LPS beta-1,4-glucosyltransferase
MVRAVRLAGFVIHGNSAETLARCLDSLTAVCDDVLAVDSCSTDGSADLVRERGVRAVVHVWEGYGAARATAVQALPPCDHVFFLDSDEYLLPPAIQAIRAWKESPPRAPHTTLVRRDWAELPGRRFLFRTERHVRLVRRDAATWAPSMVVHEALPARESATLDAFIEHRFVTSVAQRHDKEDRYALLWALRATAEGWRRKPVWPQRLVHTFRNGVAKGALFRGGRDGLALAWNVSRYHARKHAYLAEVQQGGHAEALRALREGRFRDLYRLVGLA